MRAGTFRLEPKTPPNRNGPRKGHVMATPSNSTPAPAENVVRLSPLRAARERARLVSELEEAGVHRGPMLALLIALYQSQSAKKRRAVVQALKDLSAVYPDDPSFGLALRMVGHDA